MNNLRYPLIALCGYARTGKDEVGKILIEAGYWRLCFGDLIKAQVDPIVRKHLGFSAFTEVDEQKKQIRRTLQYWGEDNYDNIFDEYFNSLVTPAVNTRLSRLREAEEWVKRGGILIEVTRPSAVPETDWNANIMQILRASGLIHSTLNNCGTLQDLRDAVKALYL